MRVCWYRSAWLRVALRRCLCWSRRICAGQWKCLPFLPSCKRSAVRARLAPLVRSESRKTRTASTAGKYNNGGRLGRCTCVFGSGVFPRLGLLVQQRIPDTDQRWRACHLGKPRRSAPVTLARPPGTNRSARRRCLPVAVAAFVSARPRSLSLWSDDGSAAPSPLVRREPADS